MSTAPRTIAVIDLKAFYAFVECIDRGLDPFKAPLVVADIERGKNTIILSVTPYLKAHGVPSRLRYKELPAGFDYIYAVPRMERYIEKSNEIVSILLEFFSYDDIHVYSIDESFIDLTSYIPYYKKSAMEIVQMVIKRISDKTGLTATGGIGDNFFLSKVALDIFAKKEPTGIAVMHQSDVQSKLWPITPLNKIWGIGERSMAKLNALGIFTVGDLAKADRSFMNATFGIMGDQLIDHANGIDESDLHEPYVPVETSVSIGQVLFRDFNYKEVLTIVREMNDDLCVRLRAQQKTTQLVSLYIGYSQATQGGFSKQMSLIIPTDENRTLYNALLEIYKKNIKDLPIRNVGIRFGKLKDATCQQLSLFGNQENQIKNRDLETALDKIHDKYGKNAVVRASALTDSSTTMERHQFIGGHKK